MRIRFLTAGLIFSFLLIFSTAKGQSEKVMTLQECLKLAIENSPRLRINALEQTKLGYRYQEAVGAGLPHINMSGSFDDYVSLPTQLIPGDFFGKPGELIPVQFGTSYNLSGGMDLTQVIYNQTWLVSLRMAKLAMQQNQLESERVRIEVIFDVAQSYYYAQITKKQMLNRKDNLQKIEKAEQIALSLYKNGMIKKIDVDRIVVNKLNVQTEIDRLQVMYTQQLNMQRYFMGLDLHQEIAFPDTILPSDINLQLQGQLSNHIDIRMIEKQKQLAQTGVKLNRSEYFPSVNLVGAVNYMNQSNTYYVFGKETDWFNTSLVGVRVNVPVFNGLQKHYKVSQAKVDIDQLAITEDNTRRILSFQSQDATNRLLNAINDELRQRENMRLAERVYAVSQEQYHKGIITLTDLLDTESGLAAAQTNHSLALVQMKIAELEYRKANGTLLEILGEK